MEARVIAIMGVAGAGKSTLGTALARLLEFPFLEGDEFHPPENIRRMSAGQPLTDSDRAPWLAAINRRAGEYLAAGQSVVMTCSALKQSYRDILSGGIESRIVFLALELGPEEAGRRLACREHFFAAPGLLDEQFDSYERPLGSGVVVLDAEQPIESLLRQAIQALQHGGATQ